MPLYGHELSETIDPLTAGLEFAVNLEGRAVSRPRRLARIAAAAARPLRVGLELSGRRVPREHYPIRRGRPEPSAK